MGFCPCVDRIIAKLAPMFFKKQKTKQNRMVIKNPTEFLLPCPMTYRPNGKCFACDLKQNIVVQRFCWNVWYQPCSGRNKDIWDVLIFKWNKIWRAHRTNKAKLLFPYLALHLSLPSTQGSEWNIAPPLHSQSSLPFLSHGCWGVFIYSVAKEVSQC